jgi:hypothetical protein
MALLVVAECPAGGNKGAANKYTTFTFDGGEIDWFTDIDGTITIDTVHGSVVSANLYVNTVFATEAFDGEATVSTNSLGDVGITVHDPAYNGSWIVLTLPVTSLKKYAGGDVIASESYWYDGYQAEYLLGGYFFAIP